MMQVQDAILDDQFDTDVRDAAKSIGICPKTLPAYMEHQVYTLVSEAVIYLVPAVFADFNMAFYPPGPDTALGRACEIFQRQDGGGGGKKGKDGSAAAAALKKLSDFYDLRGKVEYGEKAPKCFDLNLELPTGKHSRIMGADWSGSGGGFTGEVWEFQCCKDLVIRAGYSENSMFIPREWSYFWHREHCHERFPGVPVGTLLIVLARSPSYLFSLAWSRTCESPLCVLNN